MVPGWFTVSLWWLRSTMAGGSVGLVNPDGEMIVLNEGEVKIGCRLVEVAEMQTSTLAVLDCGQGEVPYRIGDEFRAEPI